MYQHFFRRVCKHWKSIIEAPPSFPKFIHAQEAVIVTPVPHIKPTTDVVIGFFCEGQGKPKELIIISKVFISIALVA